MKCVEIARKFEDLLAMTMQNNRPEFRPKAFNAEKIVSTNATAIAVG